MNSGRFLGWHGVLGCCGRAQRRPQQTHRRRAKRGKRQWPLFHRSQARPHLGAHALPAGSEGSWQAAIQCQLNLSPVAGLLFGSEEGQGRTRNCPRCRLGHRAGGIALFVDCLRCSVLFCFGVGAAGWVFSSSVLAGISLPCWMWPGPSSDPASHIAQGRAFQKEHYTRGKAPEVPAVPYGQSPAGALGLWALESTRRGHSLSAGGQ